MKQFLLYQEEFGAPPPPPPPRGTPTPPPPPSGGLQGDKSSTRAVWALILGIAAWVLGCGILTGIPAWIMGKKELNEIEAGLSSAGKTGTNWHVAQIINVIISILVVSVYIYSHLVCSSDF
jgi:uncharacterized Tic20 family protein